MRITKSNSTVFAMQAKVGIAVQINANQVGNYKPAPKLWISVMANQVVPHFQNDGGLSIISVGSKEFMCVGASPPFDHPHVFLDMGADSEIVCPYCSTHYKYVHSLGAGVSDPAECIWSNA